MRAYLREKPEGAGFVTTLEQFMIHLKKRQNVSMSILLLCVSTIAQTYTGRILGTVTDSTKSVGSVCGEELED